MINTHLALLQLGDTFFPSGMFTQSHGLESFVAAGLRGEASLEPLLQSYLLHQAAPAEALAARWVARAAIACDVALVQAIDERLLATKFAPEARSAAQRCGGRMLLLGCDLFDHPLLRAYSQQVAAGQAPGQQAVAMALLGVAAGLDEEAIVAVELHTFTVSLISAAVRLGALDHIGGQRLLLRARPVMMQAAAIGATIPWQELGGFAPQIELMQFRHRYDDWHMFVS
jgi:urease accessory protein